MFLLSQPAHIGRRLTVIFIFTAHRAHRQGHDCPRRFHEHDGDPVFDGTLRQGLAIQLEQSPFLSLVSEERIQQTLRLMGQPAMRDSLQSSPGRSGANRKRRCPRRLDFEPWQPVHRGLARTSLSHGRHLSMRSRYRRQEKKKY